MDEKYLLAVGLIMTLVSSSVLASDTNNDISSENEVLANEFKELKKSVDDIKLKMGKSKLPLGKNNLIYELQFVPNIGSSDATLSQDLPGIITINPYIDYLIPDIEDPENIKICLSSCCQVEIYRKWSQTLEHIENAEALSEKIEELALGAIDDLGLDECQAKAISWMIYFDAVSKND
tara:strand:+ start:968 stop:1501 length:534 start_codon:yes stop_codon:yes gene_type:complete